MNIVHTELLHKALKNLKRNTGIVGTLKPHKQEASIALVIQNNTYPFIVHIKKEVRPHQVGLLMHLPKKEGKPLLLIAEYIMPAAKEELRNLAIPYLETNGNVYLPLNKYLIWVEVEKPQKITVEKNKAFTPTGLQVVFNLLVNPALINLTQRELAIQTHVGLGQINNVLNGLKADGFLIKKNKAQFILRHRTQLFEKWIAAYPQRLKPKLKLGNFRFVHPTDFEKWNTIPLKKGITFWGAEPAGNLLTDYLYPKNLTLYTQETPQELIKNYRMIPDANGKIEVYKKFWQDDNQHKLTVPPVLVYADLINNQDKRCRETAQMIYEQYIENRLIESEV
ncbi:MAG: type IV toxin-antitoxin system AbiEi family antitoxin [Cyclobacteriaceae bacterium]|nr:type IV toxin-antitoxin system AbiEi family antitoxin [Cyclobacteriaceae bacterium]